MTPTDRPNVVLILADDMGCADLGHLLDATARTQSLVTGQVDAVNRRAACAQAQSMLSEESGMVCFAVGDAMDGCNVRLMGLAPNGRFDMNDQRLAEKGRFA